MMLDPKALRARALTARRIAKEVRDPADAEALRQMASDLEAEAELLENQQNSNDAVS